VKLLKPESGEVDSFPVLCVRSFFSRTVSQVQKQRRRIAMAAVSFLTILVLTVTFVQTQVAYAVYFNGAEVGSVRSMSEVNAAVSNVEQKVKEAFGDDYSIEGAIFVSPALGSAKDSPDIMAEAILSGIEGLVKLPVLKVNDTIVGAGESEEQLRDLVESVLDAYTTSDAVKVDFRQAVVITQEYVREDIQRSPDVLRTLIDPANTNSPYSLTIEIVQQDCYTEIVPCQTHYIKDPTIYEGEEVVLLQGADGVLEITENILYVNGELDSKWVANAAIVSEPVDGLVAVGTAKRPPTASTGRYIWPTKGIISSYFGRRTGFGSSNHQGIDIANKRGTDIVAADGGLVVRAGWGGSGYGKLVIIEHDNGDHTYYAHCSNIIVSAGERVKQGQVIATMGATGVANGSHCHFEIRVNNKPVNPITLLPEKESM
jgi:hypothetical protein